MFPESVILVFGGNSNGNAGLARALSDHYRVVESENLEDALRHVAEGIDLVIGHLDVPNSDSLQLLRRWKTRESSTPFLLVTKGRDVSSAVQAMKWGAADCMVEPVDPSELRTVVSNLLESDADPDTGPDSHHEGDKPTIDIPPGTSLEELERAAVEQALAQHHGNRTHAAKTLGISVRTLQRKLKAWGMPLHSHYGNGPHTKAPSTNGPGSNILYSVHEAAGTPFSAHVH